LEDEQEEVVAVVAVVSSSSSCMAECNMHRRLCNATCRISIMGTGGIQMQCTGAMSLLCQGDGEL
jgi:hypothetical protein